MRTSPFVCVWSGPDAHMQGANRFCKFWRISPAPDFTAACLRGDEDLSRRYWGCLHSTQLSLPFMFTLWYPLLRNITDEENQKLKSIDLSVGILIKEYSITLPLTQWKPKLDPIEFLVETSILSKFDVRLHVLISAIREAQKNTGSRDARYVLISQGKPSKDIYDKIKYFLHFAPDPCGLIERMKEPLSSLSLIALLVPSTKIFHMDVSYFLGQFCRKPSLIILNSRHLHLKGNMIWTHQQMQKENKGQLEIESQHIKQQSCLSSQAAPPCPRKLPCPVPRSNEAWPTDEETRRPSPQRFLSRRGSNILLPPILQMQGARKPCFKNDGVL